MRTTKLEVIHGIEYIIGEVREFMFKGKKRFSIKARLPKGKNLITFVKYENESISAPLRTHIKASF